MARGATASSSWPRADQDVSVINSNPDGEDKKSSKRRCVQSACVPCRKRKSKCDGRTPFCATCTAVYQTECYYDERDTRRNKQPSASYSSSSGAGTKREAPDEGTSTADLLLNTIRELPDDQVQDFIRQLRRHPSEDLDTLAESWRQNVELPPSTPVDVNSLEHELSLLLGKPAITFAGESRHLGHSASLGLVPEEENFANARARSTDSASQRQGTTWSTVTSDLAFVGDLLTLYFNWSHPFYVLLSRECFYKDFRSGREKYCSPLLVNAICAYACHFTDDPKARTDPSNFRTAGDHFFAEAKQLLFEDESPSLTTVQALCVMAMREASTARDSSGFSYMGRCIRMCIELGLHISNIAGPELGLTPSEIEVRKVTFWGCFTVDSAYSICVGRIAQLPRAAITLDKPILDEATEPLLNSPQPSSGTVPSRVFLQEFSILSELVNDNNYMFFAPREPLNSTKLLDQYSKYQAWYKKLPPALVIEGKTTEPHYQAEPHILVLHMLYYTIIIHLFRPMLKFELLQSEVRPRDVCIEAANKISDLIRAYRSHYSLRQAHLIVSHILLTICTVHLMYSRTSTTARQNLIEGLQGLEDLHECHYFGARSFRIIFELAKQWQFPWPKELQASKLIPEQHPYRPSGNLGPTPDPLLVAPNSAVLSSTRTTANASYLPIGHRERRESLSMFAEGYPQLKSELVTPQMSRVLPSQARHSPASGQAQSSYPGLPIHSYPYAHSISAPSSLPTAGTSSNTETFFFNPLPGMPGPTHPRSNYIQGSSLGVENILRSTDTGDALVRDGFKLDGEWQNSQSHEYAQHSTSNNQYPAYPTVPSNDFTSRGGLSYQQADGTTQYPPQNETRGAHGQQSGSYDPWWSDVKFNPNP